MTAKEFVKAVKEEKQNAMSVYFFQRLWNKSGTDGSRANKYGSSKWVSISVCGHYIKWKLLPFDVGFGWRNFSRQYPNDL